MTIHSHTKSEEVLDQKKCSFLPHTSPAYSFEEYLNLIKMFHGHVAPGLVMGGQMVDLALKHLPTDILFDAYCET